MCTPQAVYCFVCYRRFSKDKGGKRCKRCGDFKCPLCGGCLCNLSLEGKRVALAMMRTYESLLGNNYDFSVHERVEREVKRSLKIKDE